VVKVQVPSLNQRRDDILPIAKKFLYDFAEKFGKHFDGISPGAENALEKNDWKGNIRELKNVIEKSVLVESGPELQLTGFIEAINPREATPSSTASNFLPPLTNDGLSLGDLLASIEKRYIDEALRQAEGNETAAARLLGLKYTTLRYRKRILNKR